MLSAAAALVATALPWSSTAAAGRDGWETASLALAIGEAVREPVLTALACTWFAVPLAAAAAFPVSLLLPWRSAAVALRLLGALLALAVLIVLVALHRSGMDVAPFGPLLALTGGTALAVLPVRDRARPPLRRARAATTGVQA
jgi:hypothetical protein